MAGASVQSLTGMLYAGPWKKEPTVTVVRRSSQEWHVCVKEIRGQYQHVYYKRIVAILESERLAYIVVGVISDPRNEPLLKMLTRPLLSCDLLPYAQTKKKPTRRHKN